MESKNFLKWFFSSNSSSKDSSPAMPASDDARSSSPAPQSPPVSGDAPTDPGPAAADGLVDAIRQLDLKQPVPAEHEAEGGGEGDGKSGGVVEEEKQQQDREPGGEVEVEGEGAEEEDEERNEHGNESEREGDDQKEDAGGGSGRKIKFPVRPEAEDCGFYIKTGTCKFGSNCRFNHPVRRRHQATKEKVKDKDESKEKAGQVECKYYLTPSGCKYGKACRFNHSKANTVAPVAELNFLGLPIRHGEKECPFYMRTGTCKFAANCKFNHPDPTSGSEPPVEYSNGGSAPFNNSSQFPVWSPSGALNKECPPYVPMIYSPPQVVSSPNAEWNGYQFTLTPQAQSMHSPPAYVMTSPTTTDRHIYANHQQQLGAEECPERPGQPECIYFLKTGDCKFKSNCKYHHPKDRIPRSPQVALSDKGLPLRPDQNICSYYSRYGICKFGPACKFDHSVQLDASTIENLPSSREKTIP